MIAVAVPILIALLLTHRFGGREAAVATRIFAVATALWLAPCWIAGRTPVALDYLTTEAPWAHLRPDGYLTKNFLLNDITLQILPWREAVTTTVRAGDLPFFNRFGASGSLLWENPQAAALHPVTIAGLALPSFSFALFAAACRLLIALLGTYLFLRRLGTGHAAGIFGAIAYAFGAFTIAYLLFPVANVTSTIPWALWILLRLRDEPTAASFAGGSLIVFALLAGGHPESVFHGSLLAVPFAVVVATGAGRTRFRYIGRLALVGLCGALLAAPLIIPFLRYLPETQRLHDIAQIEGYLGTASFEPQSFLPFILPNYFGNPRVHNYRHALNFNDLCTQYTGLATLALAVAFAIARPVRELFWIVMLALFVLLSIQPVWLQHVISNVPLLDVTAHAKVRFLVSLVVAILGARAFDAWSQRQHRPVFAGTAVAIAILVSVVALLSYPVFAEYGVRRLIFFTSITPLLSVAVIAFHSLRPLASAVVFVPALLFLDLFGVMGLYNPALPRSEYYPSTPAIAAMQSPDTPHRIMGIDQALLPGSSVFFGLEDIRTHDPIAWRPYVELLDRAGYDRSTYFGRFIRMPPRALVDFLGVTHVIAESDVTVEQMQPVHRGEDAVVYRNAQALPRYFVPQAIVHSDDPVASLLRSSDARIVLVRDVPPQPISAASITIAAYEPSFTRLTTRATSPTFIASSELLLPGRTLTRNGSEWPMFEVNGIFLGWQVPEGESEFVIGHHPRGLAPGLILAAIGILLMVAVTLRSRAAHSSDLA